MYLTNILSTEVNSSYITFALILFFVVLSVIPVIIGSAAMGKLRHLTAVILAALNHCEYKINHLEGCQMENLPLIRNLVQEENYPKLSETFAEFELDSSKLFHGKWTTDLRKYINREHLLTQSQYRLLEADKAYQVLAFGLFTSAFALITTFTVNNSAVRGAQPFTLLPALTATIFFFIIYYRSNNSRKDIDSSMKKLAESASLRLPIFSELAGSAVLIDAFMQYDRKMDLSVRQLSTAVDNLLTQEVVQAISSSITSSMEQYIVPHIVASHNLLQELSQSISQKQDAGMTMLAENFTNQVTEILARRMESFFREIDSYLQQLNDTKGELAQALQLLDSHRQRADILDSKMHEHLGNLETHNLHILEAVNKMAEAQENLGYASKTLSELQTGSSNSLATLFNSLVNQINGFTSNMTQLTKDIQDANINNEKVIANMIEHQNITIKNYGKLSENILTNGQNLTRQADAINRQFETLNDKLNSSVDSFSTALLSGVNGILQEFDEQVGDVTDRLSLAAAEIRDSAEIQRQTSTAHKED